MDDPSGLAAQLGLTSVRIITKLLDHWRSRLSPSDRLLLTSPTTTVGEEEPFPAIALAPDFKDCNGPLLKNTSFIPLQETTGKTFYRMMPHPASARALGRLAESRELADVWRTFNREAKQYTIQQWWDYGKAQVKQLCQQLTRGVTKELVRNMKDLEQQVGDIIRKYAAGFYKDLYGSEWSSNPDMQDSFLRGLPQVGEDTNAGLAAEVTLPELHATTYCVPGRLISDNIQRGVRQGCSLSGMLYTIAIEPLLHRLRQKLVGICFPQCPVSFKLSVYADDLIVLTNSQQDIDVLANTVNDFGFISSAKVNWGKSEALMAGGGLGEGLTLPGGLQWKSGGLRYLGVFLGEESFMRRNWEDSLEKTRGKLEKWKWLLPKMSFRGRTLVINNIVSSSLWHKLTVVEPPAPLLSQIQRVLVDFIWDKLHWIPQSVLFLPKEEGGQGLVHLASRRGPPNWAKLCGDRCPAAF
uniref:Reverse transcriptase domain-containing protein n=1 Tax=Tetraodon nigroviridis TaxID=99883 RepID=H3CBZ6_TETNG